jgi:hypothetical protein
LSAEITADYFENHENFLNLEGIMTRFFLLLKQVADIVTIVFLSVKHGYAGL